MSNNLPEIIDYIKSHAKVLKPSRGREQNYPCPNCNDGKQDNFYFNVEKGTGFCQKCNTKYSAYEYAKILGYVPEKKKTKSNFLEWIYTDKDGRSLYKKRRYDFPDGNKTYQPVIFYNGSWTPVKAENKELQDIFANTPKVIYNLPKVKQADVVFFTEGEKCAERLQNEISNADDLIKYRWASTTIYDNTKGKFNRSYTDALQGKIVIILPDNDETGKEFAEKVLRNIKKYCRALICNIPDLKEKGDVFDYLETHSFQDFKNLVTDKIPSLGTTDLDRSKRFVRKYKSEILSGENGWHIWTGKKWTPDDNRVMELAKYFSQNMADELTAKYKENPETNKQYKILSQTVSRERSIKAIINLSRTDAEIQLKESALDSNINLLNLNNGTYDLVSHIFREHKQDDLLSNILPYDYDPKAKCPIWEKFLNTVFEGNEELIKYIQKILGYTLTGETKLQAWFFLYGSGRNGKSVFSEIISRLMDSYGTKIRTESIMAKEHNSENANPDIAKLKGKRLVIASEISDAHRLNESLIKDLTGGDKISARFLNRNPIEFSPQCKLFMYGNHKPFVRGTDDGIWRRIKLIPFKYTIPENAVDPLLIEKLTKEISGILNWCLIGLKELQKQNYLINEPDIIKDETKAYRSEMDVIGQFLEEYGYTYNQFYKEKMKTVYEDYTEYCKCNGYATLSQRRITDYLNSKGVMSAVGSGNARIYQGIGKTA